MDDSAQATYEKALDLLRNLATESGFIAALSERANYRRIFSRDGVVTGLAALISNDDFLIGTFRNTLFTLQEAQDQTGRIPSNVAVDKKSISYGATVGRIDATLWYVVGVCQYYLKTKDKEFLKDFSDSLEKAVYYLSCLELNGRGLIYIPPGGDWADEYISNGYVLYDQLLYYLALSSYQKVTKRNGDITKAVTRLKKLINVNYFPQAKDIKSKYVYHKESFRLLATQRRPILPIASFYQSTPVEGHLDNFANALILHTDILKKGEADSLQQEINSRFLSDDDSILPANYPVIYEDSPHWSFLKQNFRFDFRNRPNEYHNGGLWPLVHGFYLAAIEGGYGEELLERFSDKLRSDDYCFPEFYHGLNGQPGGVPLLGFSAAAYVIAYQTIVAKETLFR